MLFAGVFRVYKIETLATKGLKANSQTSFSAALVRTFCCNKFVFNIYHTICRDYSGTFPASKTCFNTKTVPKKMLIKLKVVNENKAIL